MSGTDGAKRRQEESFFTRLSGLLNAGPEAQRFPEKKKRRVEDIVTELCQDAAAKTQPVRPWVYDDFLTRLRSFKASTWFAMPRELSPLECARNGWVNCGPSTIKCLACGVEIKYIEGMFAVFYILCFA
jgi:hypothetical protein